MGMSCFVTKTNSLPGGAHPARMARALSQGARILLCMHVNPDGDTLGSALALAEALRALGKQVTVLCADPPAPVYAFLPGIDMLRQPGTVCPPDTVCLPGTVCPPDTVCPPGTPFDVSVAIDVADAERLGSARAAFEAAPVRLVMDHHATNAGFGTDDWIEPCGATAVLVQACIAALGVPLTPSMAANLYVAVCTDTGNFNFSNTDARTLRAAAALVEVGIDVPDITGRLYRTRTRAGVQLLARALSTLAFDAARRVATLTLAARDFAEVGASEGESEGIVNYAIEIEGVLAAALLRETPRGVKCSLRARTPLDATRVAVPLGGGGHAAAAGCTLALPLAAAQAEIQAALTRLVSAREGEQPPA